MVSGGLGQVPGIRCSVVETGSLPKPSIGGGPLRLQIEGFL